MHVKDVENLLLTASCQHFLLPRDPSEFVVEIDVRIDRYDGNQEQTVQIGGASLFLIDEQRVLDYGESLLEVMDAHSQELTDVYSALFDAEGDYWEEFEEQDFLGRSLLYIDFLYLHPEYRGHRIGQLAMLGLIESFGAGADIVVTEPDPLYFHEEERNLKLQLSETGNRRSVDLGEKETVRLLEAPGVPAGSEESGHPLSLPGKAVTHGGCVAGKDGEVKASGGFRDSGCSFPR